MTAPRFRSNSPVRSFIHLSLLTTINSSKIPNPARRTHRRNGFCAGYHGPDDWGPLRPPSFHQRPGFLPRSPPPASLACKHHLPAPTIPRTRQAPELSSLALRLLTLAPAVYGRWGRRHGLWVRGGHIRSLSRVGTNPRFIPLRWPRPPHQPSPSAPSPPLRQFIGGGDDVVAKSKSGELQRLLAAL
jgi:hypothetical protein